MLTQKDLIEIHRRYLLAVIGHSAATLEKGDDVVALLRSWNDLEKLLQDVERMRAFVRRVAVEPVGHALASHREVLDILAKEAKSLLAEPR